MRHGWWKINDLDTIHDIINCLHVRGVREKELRINLLSAIADSLDLSTPENTFNDQLGILPNEYVLPEPMSGFNLKIARRVEVALLEQVESMEDKVASASMQMKGWIVPSRDENEPIDDSQDLIPVIRERILGLEGAIERRYLKPPLGTK